MANEVITINRRAKRTASIEYLEVTVAYADFATKEFGEAQALYFDDIEAKDEKILSDLAKETGKVYQAVTARKVVNGLFEISNADYVKYAERVGDAREKKQKEEPTTKAKK